MHLIYLAIFSLILGIGAKYADLVNEHGLKAKYPGAKIIAGWIWGLAGMGMVYVSPYGGLTYIAHILYWFLRVKLDYPNHALAGVMMVFAGFLFQGEFLTNHAVDLLAVFLGYAITGYVHSYFKVHYPKSRAFLRLRLRIYLVPIIYAIVRMNVEPLIATGFGMIACELMTWYFKDYKDDVVLTPYEQQIRYG